MKNQIVFFVAVLFAGALHSQNPQWRWANRTGGTGAEIGNSISVDQDGNIYTLGIFSSSTITFGNIILTKVGTSTDIFILKSDSSGNTIWAQRIGGNELDKSESLTIDPLGNLLVSGTFYSDTLQIGSIVMINSDSLYSDVFIAKYDTAGNALWAVSAGGNYGDLSRGIAGDAAGNVYVTGEFYSTSLAFGNIIINNAAINFCDGFIVKYNTLGIPQWAKRFGGGSNDFGAEVCTDDQANVYLIGDYESNAIQFDSFTFFNNGGSDAFLVKYDSAGTALSAKNFGGTGNEYPEGICIDASGSIYLTGGYSSTSITFGSTIVNSVPGFGDIYICKYDAAFNEGWIVHAGGINGERGWAITCDAAGNVYACGGFNNSITFGSTTLTSAFGPDPFMVHCDSAGNVLWAVSAPGIDQTDVAYSVVVHNGATYYTGVFQSSSIDFGNFTLTNPMTPNGDLFIARLDTMQTVSTAEKKNVEETISLVPNPFSNKVLISFYVLNPDQTSLKIFDLTGKQVFGSDLLSWVPGENQFIWDASTEHEGVYFLQIESAGNFRTEKLILVK